jgi:hypothetical protein
MHDPSDDRFKQAAQAMQTHEMTIRLEVAVLLSKALRPSVKPAIFSLEFF